jgi:hypothetical protein
MTLTPNQSNASMQALPSAITSLSAIAARLPALPADTYNRCETFSWALSVFDSFRSPTAISPRHCAGSTTPP